MEEKQQKSYVPALGFHGLTRFYDKLIGIAMPEKAFKIDLVEQACIQPGFKVLDFGCGTATLTKLAANMYPETMFTGVDVDRNILNLAKEKISDDIANVKLELYDGSKLPYESQSFDRVISSLVFHHLTKPQKENAFAEISRVLKPNGELHIADWGKASNVLMRILYYPVQIFDGFDKATDNVKGLLPSYIKKIGIRRNLSYRFL